MPSGFQQVFVYMPFGNEYFDPQFVLPVADKFNTTAG
jgi:hypothetical protein